MGNNEDGGAFPVAEKQSYVSYEVVRRFFQASIQLTGGIMAAGKRAPTVARDAVESEVRGMLTGVLKHHNGMYFRDGTGVVATAMNNFGGSTSLQANDARMLWDGVTYDVYNATLAVHRGTITVSSTAQALNGSGYAVVTLSANAPAACVSTDVIVWRNSVSKAFSGLDILIDDAVTPFQGVNVATYPRYASLVLSNSGVPRPISSQLLRQFLAGLWMKSGKKSGSLKLYASPWQAKEFEEMYEGELRYSPNDKSNGREVTSFQSSLGRISYEIDTDMLNDKLFAADLSQIHRAEQKALGWRLQGGEIFLRSDQANVYTATMDEICELHQRASYVW
jgi:hypothetical protein